LLMCCATVIGSTASLKTIAPTFDKTGLQSFAIQVQEFMPLNPDILPLVYCKHIDVGYGPVLTSPKGVGRAGELRPVFNRATPMTSRPS
jgi:hypothetical protein